MHTPSFKCPHCEHIMGRGPDGPRFTAVPSPGPVSGVAVISSCAKCSAALGAAWTPGA